MTLLATSPNDKADQQEEEEEQQADEQPAESAQELREAVA
jgi:hypothetical protein